MSATDRESRIYRITVLGSIVNMLLLAFKFIAGFIGHSGAMIADAAHSLSDFLTDLVVIVFVRISSKPADENHEYGHGKFETLATAIIGFALAAVGFMLGWGGLSKIISFARGEVLEQPGIIALVAAVVSVASKEWLFRATKKVAAAENSPALEANAWHHRSDALSSIGTTLGIGGAVILGRRWAVLDPVAAVIVSVLIVFTAFKLISESLGELLERSLPKDLEEKIKALVYEEEGVSDLHHFHSRKLGGRIAVEMHLRMRGDLPLYEAHLHAGNIEKRLRGAYGQDMHIMLHLEPEKSLLSSDYSSRSSSSAEDPSE